MLVMDNLNTHHPASLYAAFEPAEARRIAQRLEIPPKHGSWLNIAEIELGVLARQCLDRRMPGRLAGKPERRATKPGGNRVDWRFTTEDARIKLPSTRQYNSGGRAGRLPPPSGKGWRNTGNHELNRNGIGGRNP